MVKEEKKVVNRYEAVNIPTNYERGIYDNETEETKDLYTALAEIMSDVKEMKKIIKG